MGIERKSEMNELLPKLYGKAKHLLPEHGFSMTPRLNRAFDHAWLTMESRKNWLDDLQAGVYDGMSQEDLEALLEAGRENSLEAWRAGEAKGDKPARSGCSSDYAGQPRKKVVASVPSGIDSLLDEIKRGTGLPKEQAAGMLIQKAVEADMHRGL